MLYSIIGYDVESSLELRKVVRQDHLARVNQLRDEGRLVIAGPNPALDTNEPGEAGFTGSVIIAEFNSLEEAQAWANDDPYMSGGVYERVIVKPFKQVLP